MVRVKVWTLDGRVVYSDQRPLVGRRFALEPGVPNAVRNRLVVADVSDLERPENRYERHFGKLLEVYLPIDAPDGRRLLFEDYIRFERNHRQRAAPLRSLRARAGRGAPAALAGAAAVGMVAHPPSSPAPAEREALLRRAIDASALERRRIAQHLHDGVVQDLAGVS